MTATPIVVYLNFASFVVLLASSLDFSLNKISRTPPRPSRLYLYIYIMPQSKSLDPNMNYTQGVVETQVLHDEIPTCELVI